MAIPNVFVSSTFYDLRYIRGNLQYLVTTLGYNPVLSEHGAVFYDPAVHVLDAAVAEIPNCHLFVLIIGGRYGADFHDTGHSITNAEYKEAARLNIPIFALVESGVYGDYQVYKENRSAVQSDANSIVFPHADDSRIFAFIEEVQDQAVNNALVPFRDFGDIESYLRRQWAAMMHSYLTGEAENRRVTDTLRALEDMNSRIEVLTSQILKSVGTSAAKATAQMYQLMLNSDSVQDLRFIGVSLLPSDIVRTESFDDVAHLGRGSGWTIEEDDDGYTVSGGGGISAARYERDKEDYEELRGQLLAIMNEPGLSLDDIVAQE